MTLMGKRVSTRSDAKGFSVLEALFAVFLISTVFASLLVLQQSSLRTADSIRRATMASHNVRASANYIRAITPGMIPGGTLDLGGATLEWQATPITETARLRAGREGLGRFEGTLYRIDATLVFEDGYRKTFFVERFGWRALAPISPFQ